MARDAEDMERRMSYLFARVGLDPKRPPPPPPAKEIDVDEFERRMALLEARFRSRE